MKNVIKAAIVALALVSAFSNASETEWHDGSTLKCSSHTHSVHCGWTSSEEKAKLNQIEKMRDTKALNARAAKENCVPGKLSGFAMCMPQEWIDANPEAEWISF